MNTSATIDDLSSTANQVGDKAKASASKVAGEVKSSSSAIGNEVKNFISDLEEMVSSKTSGALDVSKIKQDITSRIADYKAQATAAGNEIVSKAKH